MFKVDKGKVSSWCLLMKTCLLTLVESRKKCKKVKSFGIQDVFNIGKRWNILKKEQLIDVQLCEPDNINVIEKVNESFCRSKHYCCNT